MNVIKKIRCFKCNGKGKYLKIGFANRYIKKCGVCKGKGFKLKNKHA